MAAASDDGMGVISVVIPTKDRLPYLRTSVAAFLSVPEVGQVVVVIDGSEDGTREFLAEQSRREPRLTVHDNGRNRGIPYGKNRGIERATCPYLFIAEDDLDVAPDLLSILLNHMDETGADLIAPRNIFRRESETRQQALARKDAERGQPTIDRRRIRVDTGAMLDGDTFQSLSGNPVLGRTEVFRSVPFDERIRKNSWREETDFQISAQERGFSLAVCPHAISYNLVIEDDRGGAHSIVGYRRVVWQVRNNWIFLSKHREFLREHFGMRHRHLRITIFALEMLLRTTLTNAVIVKRRLIGSGSPSAVLRKSD